MFQPAKVQKNHELEVENAKKLCFLQDFAISALQFRYFFTNFAAHYLRTDQRSIDLWRHFIVHTDTW
jgi:hypothetical protein